MVMPTELTDVEIEARRQELKARAQAFLNEQGFSSAGACAENLANAYRQHGEELTFHAYKIDLNPYKLFIKNKLLNNPQLAHLSDEKLEALTEELFVDTVNRLKDEIKSVIGDAEAVEGLEGEDPKIRLMFRDELTHDQKAAINAALAQGGPEQILKEYFLPNITINFQEYMETVQREFRDDDIANATFKEYSTKVLNYLRSKGLYIVPEGSQKGQFTIRLDDTQAPPESQKNQLRVLEPDIQSKLQEFAEEAFNNHKAEAWDALKTAQAAAPTDDENAVHAYDFSVLKKWELAAEQKIRDKPNLDQSAKAAQIKNLQDELNRNIEKLKDEIKDIIGSPPPIELTVVDDKIIISPNPDNPKNKHDLDEKLKNPLTQKNLNTRTFGIVRGTDEGIAFFSAENATLPTTTSDYQDQAEKFLQRLRKVEELAKNSVPPAGQISQKMKDNIFQCSKSLGQQTAQSRFSKNYDLNEAIKDDINQQELTRIQRDLGVAEEQLFKELYPNMGYTRTAPPPPEPTLGDAGKPTLAPNYPTMLTFTDASQLTLEPTDLAIPEFSRPITYMAQRSRLVDVAHMHFSVKNIDGNTFKAIMDRQAKKSNDQSDVEAINPTALLQQNMPDVVKKSFLIQMLQDKKHQDGLESKSVDELVKMVVTRHQKKMAKQDLWEGAHVQQDDSSPNKYVTIDEASGQVESICELVGADTIHLHSSPTAKLSDKARMRLCVQAMNLARFSDGFEVLETDPEMALRYIQVGILAKYHAPGHDFKVDISDAARRAIENSDNPAHQAFLERYERVLSSSGQELEMVATRIEQELKGQQQMKVSEAEYERTPRQNRV